MSLITDLPAIFNQFSDARQKEAAKRYYATPSIK